MNAKKKILIICNSDLSREPRVIRQILALKNDYEISTLGSKASDFPEVTHYSFAAVEETDPSHWKYPTPLRKLISLKQVLYSKLRRFYSDYYYKTDFWTPQRTEIVERLKKIKFDVIIAHHWDSLPLGYGIGQPYQSKLIFNAHDYYPLQFEMNENWRKHTAHSVEYVMRTFLPHYDMIFSAWTKIHTDFSEKYGVPSTIITNATEYNSLSPQLRNTEETKIRLVHHGIANANRKIEQMIDVMDHLDERFSLDFMLVSSPYDNGYYASLKKRAENKNINFIDTVPTREIARTINQYDIGLFLLPPNGFNPTYTLPNKLFEFVQARIACLVTPNIEMKKVVEQYDLGWVSKDYEPASVAAEIKEITTEELNEKKRNADKHADELSAEKNYVKIKKVVDDLLTGESPAKKSKAQLEAINE